MIDLRGLHLGNIARSPAESVRPDLWPGHAWVPALGCTGGVVHDLCGGNHGQLIGTISWGAGRTVHNADGEYIACGAMDSAPFVGGFTFFAKLIYSSSQIDTYPILFSQWSSDGRFFEVGSYQKNLFSEVRNQANTASYVRYWVSTPKDTPICVASAVQGADYPVNWMDGSLSSGTTSGTPAGINQIIGDVEIGRQNGLPLSTTFIGQIGIIMLIPRCLTPSQILDLTADPILPFRRRQPVYYSVPSGGGSARNLIAALTGESATGTISAIIARALAGDVTATSITGAITASMARDLLASLQGQSTTGDIAATLQRLLLASLGGASITGDVASIITRELGTSIAAASATGDVTASLAALVELTASISGTTTTPAVAATMARALAASLAGQSTTGAITIQFAGLLLLVASITGTSTTGALTATTSRELRAAIDATSASGQVDGQLLRQIAATVAGASVTGTIAAELVNLVSLAASVVGVSVTPDVLATVSRDLAAEVAAGSTTGEASATVARALTAAVEAGTLTPDNLVLILTGLGILHDTTIISRTPRRGISSRTVRRTIHSA